MRVLGRSFFRCLLCVLPWVSPVTSAVDVVTSASPHSSLPPPESPGTTMTLEVGDARVHVFIEGRTFALSEQALRDWVARSADIVTRYYDGFPVSEVYVAIRGTRGTRVMNGSSIGVAGAVVNVTVGISATPEALADDWIMVHELIHLAFPSVPRRHHWLEEGLSVYVEAIARANAGALSTDAVWRGFLDGMPRGLPRAGDRGLDNTPTWGRTYWGGALFCLLADIRIREATGGTKSLRDGLRAIVAAGYDMTRSGDIRDVLTIADEATGVSAMVDLYDEMRDRPLPTEVDSLWADLGVAEHDGEIVYDESAPLAASRRALTQQTGR